jgi:hypothetical protein
MDTPVWMCPNNGVFILCLRADLSLHYATLEFPSLRYPLTDITIINNDTR